MNPDFTAQMEEKLDEVSQGERDWIPMLEEFYGPFAQELLNANENMPRVKPDDEATDEVCENCGLPMVIKTGRFGRFMACTGYPPVPYHPPAQRRRGRGRRRRGDR